MSSSRHIKIQPHTFEPAKLVDPGRGLIDDTDCGFLQRIDSEDGIFCTFPAGAPVHHGSSVGITIAGEEN